MPISFVTYICKFLQCFRNRREIPKNYTFYFVVEPNVVCINNIRCNWAYRSTGTSAVCTGWWRFELTS
jgi:hypothetical protein